MFLKLLNHLTVCVLIVRPVAKLPVLFSGTNDAEPLVSSRHNTGNSCFDNAEKKQKN